MRISGLFVGLVTALAAPAYAQNFFSPEERSQILSYWAQDGRYSSSLLPDAAQNGSWRVRLTVEGSRWIWEYNRSVRPGKINPGADPAALNEQQARWDAWIDKKATWDYALAEIEAAAKNSQELGRAVAPPPSNAVDPGPMPTDLRAITTEPPRFGAAVQPKQHTVTFHDDTKLLYQDNINLRRKYAYYRFAEGVQSFGKKVKDIPESEMNALLASAGISGSEAKVMKAVSLLEGGFDSVNTYDTGFVSVGLIQFAALSAGGGSLGEVLLKTKQIAPESFNRDFRRMGLDVTSTGLLVALNPETGEEFIGPGANQRIITDKRLIATFQRAGLYGRDFRTAQLMVARSRYYPGEDSMTVVVDGSAKRIKVKEVFRTEAGMATLMDRKVNTGALSGLNEAAQRLVDRYGLRDLKDLADYEYDLIQQMIYRSDYRKDFSLSQPQRVSAARTGVPARGAPSRSGSRTIRPAPKPTVKPAAKPAPKKSTSKNPAAKKPAAKKAPIKKTPRR